MKDNSSKELDVITSPEADYNEVFCVVLVLSCAMPVILGLTFKLAFELL